MMNPFSYDLVLFGATSFLGKLVAACLADHARNKEEVRWAIAGRSMEKLLQLKNSLEEEVSPPDILVADVTDEASLLEMCRRTRVVISTVGPYALYGEPLVRACVETGADYCDLTGEVAWVWRMLQRYEAAARGSGARIVPCCGFDSVPSDMGHFFIQQQAFERYGKFCTEVKMRARRIIGGVSGGTVASMVNLVTKAKSDRQMRRVLLDPHSLCPDDASPRPPQNMVLRARYEEEFKSWTAPFVMAIVNEHVVRRSHAISDPPFGTPLIYNEGVLTGAGFRGRMKARNMTFGMGLFMFILLIPPLRWMLQRFLLPSPGQGPSPEVQQKGYFELLFGGRTEGNEQLQIRVACDSDPGLRATAKMLVQCGICLAKEISKEEKHGGFWTPATLFGDRLLARLRAHAGMSFEAFDE